MEKFLYYTKLFDCYKCLLNENERSTFSSYYEENLSMQEIADNKKVSKSAIGASIKNTELKLATFEQALHLEAKQEKLAKIITKIDNENIRKELEQIMK